MAEYDPAQPHHTADDLLPVRLRRHVPVLAVAGITIAVVGYLTGIREPRQPELPPPPISVPRAGLHDAVDYSQLPTTRLHPAVGTTGSLVQLKFDKPGIFDAVTRTEDMKREALADRAKNRAYDGAPPTIPHSVEAQSAAACLACHRDGIKVGDRVASAVSHAHFSNCLQCHVAQSPVPVANDFLGVFRAGPGTRASPGAPPTIPHTTWMRENCMSCHGLLTRPGIRTTHPWLTNCTQCHAPSAANDQRDFAGRTP
jgi:cytochrome c-type protein NapB